MALARQSIGSYQILRALEGHGREVFLAKRPIEKGDNRYVLALFEVGPEEARHLEHEVERTMELDHPSITRAVEFFEHEGKHVIAYEGVPGCSLHRLGEHLAQSGERLEDGAAMQVGLMLFRALNAAHTATDSQGKTVPLVHAHLGTHQIFISWKGEVRLLGMGLSTIFRLAAGLEPDRFVAEPFMAPEVRAGGALTVRANVFSAAAILWSLLSGKLPSQGPLQPLAKLRPDLDKKVVEVIDQALEQSLVKRTVSGVQIVRALDASNVASLALLHKKMEEVRALESFDGATIGAESFPPSGLSDVPSASMPPMGSLLPDSEDRSTIPPDSSPPSTDEPTVKRDVPAELLPKPRPKQQSDAPTMKRDVPAALLPLSKGEALPNKPAVPPVRSKKITELGIAALGKPPTTLGSRKQLPTKSNPRLTKSFGSISAGAPSDPPLEVDIDLDSKPPPDDEVDTMEVAPTNRAPFSPSMESPLMRTKKSRNDASPAASPVASPAKKGPAVLGVMKPKLAPAASTSEKTPAAKASPAVAISPVIAISDATTTDEPVGLPLAPPSKPAPAPAPAPSNSEPTLPLPAEKQDALPAKPLWDELPAPTRATAAGASKPVDDELPVPIAVRPIKLALPKTPEPAELPAPPKAAPPKAAPPAAPAKPALPPVEPPPITLRRPARPAGMDMSALTTHTTADRPRASTAKWIMFSVLGMAATFGVGVLVGRASIGDPPPVPTPLPADTTTASPPSRPPPQPEPVAEPEPDTTAEPEASAAPDDSATEVADGDIPEGFAMLHVDSSVPDAYVYVGTDPLGPVGSPNKVRCGPMFVRLGTHPLTRWLGDGRSINAPCQDTLTITMNAVGPQPGGPLPKPSPKPSPKTKTPKPKPKSTSKPKGWTPDDL